MLEELDKIQHIDVLDQVAFLAGAENQLQADGELKGGYAKCPSNILAVYQKLKFAVEGVVDNVELSEAHKLVEEEYSLYKIKQKLQDSEFEQKQEYRK